MDAVRAAHRFGWGGSSDPLTLTAEAVMPFEKPTPEQLAHRFRQHPPKGDQAERYARVRTAIKGAAFICVELTPCSPEQTRALNALDEAMMLFNAAIARNES